MPWRINGCVCAHESIYAVAVHQSSYRTWESFYNMTTAIFEEAMEYQDCCRKSKGKLDQHSTFERRIFDNAGIRIEFVQLFHWCASIRPAQGLLN